MTGYTVHTGSTVKFSGGWDRIFQGKAVKKTPGQKASKSVVASSKKKAAKKSAKKVQRSK